MAPWDNWNNVDDEDDEELLDISVRLTQTTIILWLSSPVGFRGQARRHSLRYRQLSVYAGAIR
jgi:hypothetical protein